MIVIVIWIDMSKITKKETKVKRFTLLLTTMVIAAIMFVGCDDNKTTEPSTGMLDLSITGLENLGSGFAYEGWIIVDGTPVSTGIFTVDDNGVVGGGNGAIERTEG